MIEQKQIAEIRRLFHVEQWKAGTIATQLGVHADVVTRALETEAPRERPQPATILDPYKALVREVLEQYPRLCSSRLFDMLKARGYTGSPRTLRRFVEGARPQPKTVAYLRTERLPGEQAQIDWGHVGKLRVPGGERFLWVFVIFLAHSRAIWAELVFDLTIHSLRRSLIRAAAYFGGVTRQWLFDNPKTVVLERHGDVVRFHPALLELSASFHVEPRLCGVRKPHEKGGVERSMRYLKDRFFPARTIRSIEQGNAQLLEFIAEVAMSRPHPTIPERSVREVFEEERGRLLALPPVLPTLDALTSVVVDKTAFGQFDSNRYSVPPEHVRKTLTVRASDTEIHFLDRDAVVATHARCWGKRQVIEAKEHRTAILDAKRGARELKGRDLLRAEVPRIDELLVRWLDEGRNIGSQTARVLHLLELYGSRVLREAVEELLARGQQDFGALANLCEKRRTPKAPRLPLVLGGHVPEREVVPHDLGGYDD